MTRGLMNNVSPCATCPRNSLGFCGTVFGAVEKADPTPPKDWQHHFLIPASKQVLAPNQPSPDIYVLCSGWAFRVLQLADGRRQILNFLLPGDVFSSRSLFEDHSRWTVSALTAIQVSGMRRAEVQSRITRNPATAPALAIVCSAEAEASEQLIAALGLCSAEERIAYLFLHLMKRISERNVVRANRYPFPLRQQHIAEALGLTPVHVSRIVGSFRAKGILDLSHGVLEVLNLRELQRLGSLT